MKVSMLASTAIIFLLLAIPYGAKCADTSSATSEEYLTVENQKTGLTWRFYHNVKGDRNLPQRFCQDPANDGGNNWRLPIRKEFEILIADPEFKFPPDLAAEYYSREVRNAFGHVTSMKGLVATLELGSDDVEKGVRFAGR